MYAFRTVRSTRTSVIVFECITDCQTITASSLRARMLELHAYFESSACGSKLAEGRGRGQGREESGKDGRMERRRRE